MTSSPNYRARGIEILYAEITDSIRIGEIVQRCTIDGGYRLNILIPCPVKRE
jgi:hypothetical protein